MGRDKALLPWRESTFLGLAIDLLAPFTDMVLVVAGENADQIKPIVDASASFLVCNPEPERGQFSSLQVGLQEVLNRGRDAAIVALVDRPPAQPDTVRRLKQAFMRSPDRVWAVAPRFEGRHGHPFVVGREMITAFLRAPVTSNAREVQHERADHLEYVDVDDPLVVLNVNTPEDYQRICT